MPTPTKRQPRAKIGGRLLGEVSFRILWTSLDWVFQPCQGLARDVITRNEMPMALQQATYEILPSGKRLHSCRKYPIDRGFSHEKWWFSIVMLVYQRVCAVVEQKTHAWPMPERAGKNLAEFRQTQSLKMTALSLNHRPLLFQICAGPVGRDMFNTTCLASASFW